IGLAVACNDRGALRLETYVSTRSARGEATRFQVSNLPDTSRVQVLRDESSYAAWRATSSSTIEVDTDVGEHRFAIATVPSSERAGGRGGEPTKSRRTPSASPALPI